jgi:hypothetical protein
LCRFDRMPEAVEAGGYMPVMTPELIEEQKGIVWELLRQFGQAITQGRDLTSVSLPIQLFEPRSYLERLTDAWVYGPIFLTRAGRRFFLFLFWFAFGLLLLLLSVSLT